MSQERITIDMKDGRREVGYRRDVHDKWELPRWLHDACTRAGEPNGLRSRLEGKKVQLISGATAELTLWSCLDSLGLNVEFVSGEHQPDLVVHHTHEGQRLPVYIEVTRVNSFEDLPDPAVIVSETLSGLDLPGWYAKGSFSPEAEALVNLPNSKHLLSKVQAWLQHQQIDEHTESIPDLLIDFCSTRLEATMRLQFRPWDTLKKFALITSFGSSMEREGKAVVREVVKKKVHQHPGIRPLVVALSIQGGLFSDEIESALYGSRAGCAGLAETSKVLGTWRDDNGIWSSRKNPNPYGVLVFTSGVDAPDPNPRLFIPPDCEALWNLDALVSTLPTFSIDQGVHELQPHGIG